MEFFFAQKKGGLFFRKECYPYKHEKKNLMFEINYDKKLQMTYLLRLKKNIDSSEKSNLEEFSEFCASNFALIVVIVCLLVILLHAFIIRVIWNSVIVDVFSLEKTISFSQTLTFLIGIAFLLPLLFELKDKAKIFSIDAINQGNNNEST